MKKGLLIFLGIVVVLGLVLFGTFKNTYNTLIDLSVETDSAWSEVENQLKRRADLIPNLLETVKGSAAHEKDVIDSITEARAGYSNASSIEDYEEAEKQFSNAMTNLNIMVENYPDLKANENFKEFQVNLEGTENRIAVARGRYNDSVKEYNKTVKKFPTNIIASMLNFEAKPYFEISNADKEVPKVEF